MVRLSARGPSPWCAKYIVAQICVCTSASRRRDRDTTRCLVHSPKAAALYSIRERSPDRPALRGQRLRRHPARTCGGAGHGLLHWEMRRSTALPSLAERIDRPGVRGRGDHRVRADRRGVHSGHAPVAPWSAPPYLWRRWEATDALGVMPAGSPSTTTGRTAEERR